MMDILMLMKLILKNMNYSILGDNLFCVFVKWNLEEYLYKTNYTDLKTSSTTKVGFFYLPILLENIDFEILPALKSTLPFFLTTLIIGL